MYLGPVTLLDCLVFCIFLAPQLLKQAGILRTTVVALRFLPFLFIQLPLGLAYARIIRNFWSSRDLRPREKPFFEDFVLRCVRYAFVNIPPRVGRVFTSRDVALPFLRFRFMRQGRRWNSVTWHENAESSFKGIWVVTEPLRQPDICIYYIHGGGFTMGSSYFYLEFLMTWVQMLLDAGFKHPAIFALEYTLVPDASFPVQLNEAFSGYEHVMDSVKDPEKICVSGDSAGAAIALALLLFLSRMADLMKKRGDEIGDCIPPTGPKMALLISPWTTLISRKHKNTPDDFLDTETLHRYARQYAGLKSPHDHLVSPGECRNLSAWTDCGVKRIIVVYGSEELLADDIEDFVQFLGECGLEIDSIVQHGKVHVWPVISLFLSSGYEKRLEGLGDIVKSLRRAMC